MKWIGLMLVAAFASGCMEPTWPSGVPMDNLLSDDAERGGFGSGGAWERDDVCRWGGGAARATNGVHHPVARKPAEQAGPILLQCS